MKKLLILLCFSFAATAQSAVYVEPKIGFGTSGIDYNSGSGANTATGITTFNAGSVFGSSIDDFYFGLDLRYDNLGNYDGSKASLNFLSVGLGIGYTLKYVPLRWTFTLDLQQRAWTDNFNDMVESGGWRMSIGYFMAKNVLASFDYSEPYYSNSTSGVKYLPRIYSLSLSFPMEFDSPKEPWKERRGYKQKMDINTDDFGAAEAAQELNQDFITTPGTPPTQSDMEFDEIAPIPDADTAAESLAEEELILEDAPASAELDPSLTEETPQSEDSEPALEDDFNIEDEL